MIIDSKIRTRYNNERKFLEITKAYVDETLMHYALSKLFAYTSRVKKIESICEKIESGRYKSWDNLDDLVGCTLILPNLSYEAEAIEFIRSAFDVIEVRERGATFKSPDAFRFDSTRIIARRRHQEGSEKSRIHLIRFEVQIKTAFEHAWAVSTHDFAYKGNGVSWENLRLAAQLKAIVEQLDMLTLSASESCNYISKSEWPEVYVKSGILVFLEEQFSLGRIPEELRPKSFSQVINNIYSLLQPHFRGFKKEKHEESLAKIIDKIGVSISNLNKDGFPTSLSLYQVFYGILRKEKLIREETIEKTTFLKPELFDTIFPDLKDAKIRAFLI